MKLADQIQKNLQKLGKKLLKDVMPESQPKPLTVESFSKLSERYSIADWLNYRFADDGGIWIKDNPDGMDSYLLGFEISPLIIAGEKATEKVETILSRLPPFSVVHSICHVSKDTRNFLERWTQARRKGFNKLFDVISKRRAKYLLDWAYGKIKPIRGSSFQPRSMRHYWFVKIPSEFSDFSEENIKTHREIAEQNVHRIIAEFKAGMFGIKRMDGIEMVKSIRLLVNNHIPPEDIKEQKIHLNEEIAKQVIDPETTVQVEDENNDLMFTSVKGEKGYARILSVINYPEQPFYLAEMAETIGSVSKASDYIPGDFYVYTTIQVLPEDKTKQKVVKKMGVMHYQMGSTKGFWKKFVPHLYRRQENIENLFNEMDKEGAIPVKVCTGIVLLSNNIPDLEKAMSAAKTIWTPLGLKLHQETAIAMPMWLANLPGNYNTTMDDNDKGLQRFTTMTAFNAANLVHIQGDWKGSPPDNGGLLLLSRRGILTVMNLLDTFKSNFNGVMAASSGSGKSFAMNEICSDFLARGGMVRIIDAGKSYFYTAETLGGHNLVFKDEDDMRKLSKEPICINPFSDIKTKRDLREDMDTLVMIVMQMAFKFGYGLDDLPGADKPYEYRVVEEAIDKAWQEKQDKMDIRDVAAVLAKSKDKREQDVARQLRPWTEGRYSSWMIGEANLELDNPFLVLELDELSKNVELQGVVLNLIMSRISREMYLNSEKEEKLYGYKLPKLIVIDEAWDLLTRPNTGPYINHFYRRLRKYLGSIFIVTQSITDCDESTAGRIALQNSNWILSLMHDIGALEVAVEKNLLTISEYTMDMIKSLQKTDDYSEMYIINKSVKGEGLYRVIVDPATYWTYTTEGTERQKLDKLVKAGFSVEQAVDQLASKVSVEDAIKQLNTVPMDSNIKENSK